MLETINKILLFSSDFSNAEEFQQDVKSFDACMMNFIALGETVDKLSEELKAKNDQIDWLKVKAFRNVIAHDYFGILSDEVWQIIKNHLPKLKADLEKLK